MKGRPLLDSRPVLLQGFRYPWPPVAEHAAEALVALNDRGAVPALQQLTAQPDPAAPAVDADKKTVAVREVVRVNHLRNCMLCHAPATAEGRVRAPIPEPGKPLPPVFRYYSQGDGPFVRADVTYLRQDFSASHPVANADPWPTLQRYDYFVRARPLSAKEQSERKAAPSASFPQRAAVLFALKELSAP